MGELTLPAQGGCRCGAIRFEITSAPVLTMACHCSGCKKMTSSAFSCAALVAPASFTILQGTPEPGGLRGEPAQMGCAQCHSWVYSAGKRFPFTFVRATLLDDPSWFQPYVESKTAQKFPWATTGAVKSFEDYPPQEDFTAALEEYAKLHHTLREDA